MLPNIDDSPSKDLWMRDGWPENLLATGAAVRPRARSRTRRCNRIGDPRLLETCGRAARAASSAGWRGTDDPLLDGPIAPPPGALVNDPDGVSALEPPQVIA